MSYEIDDFFDRETYEECIVSHPVMWYQDLENLAHRLNLEYSPRDSGEWVVDYVEVLDPFDNGDVPWIVRIDYGEWPPKVVGWEEHPEYGGEPYSFS